MYHVYVLRSLKSGKRYVGITSVGLEKRLEAHASGSTAWTRAHKPFELVRVEEFESKSLALKREKFLKSGAGRRVLDNLLLKY
jgi:putative endonuclease